MALTCHTTGVPYQWPVYDMVVLPGSFPFGGMENVQLTFLSKSLIAGDRSLATVVAHEIVHSWAGNLVTNKSWTDFWLNEGFTVYIERLIAGALATEAYRHFEIYLGYQGLVKAVTEFGEANNEYTKLQPNTDGKDPDEVFSRVPYEKGSLLLFHLEHHGMSSQDPCRMSVTCRAKYCSRQTTTVVITILTYCFSWRQRQDATMVEELFLNVQNSKHHHGSNARTLHESFRAA